MPVLGLGTRHDWQRTADSADSSPREVAVTSCRAERLPPRTNPTADTSHAFNFLAPLPIPPRSDLKCRVVRELRLLLRTGHNPLIGACMRVGMKVVPEVEPRALRQRVPPLHILLLHLGGNQCQRD